GLRARDHLPALLLEDLPDDRIALDHPLPVLTALPVAEVHLAQIGLHLGGQAQPGGQRRRGLRGAPQRAHVDRVDAPGGQPAGQAIGLLGPGRREAGVGVPRHQRERRARHVGLRLAVPDEQDVGGAGDVGEAGLRVAGRGHIQVFGGGHHAGSVMRDKSCFGPLPPGRRRPLSRGGPMTQARYDFVIVGGGSAGSALANRLSADPSARVLVLEAGRPDYRRDVFIHMPAALTFPIGSRFYDWQYESEPEPCLNGRRVYHARGKVLGGSSSINGMIFQRGNPLDYERWAASASRRSPACPAWARTCKITWRCTFSTRPSSRFRWRRRSSGATARWSARAGSSGAAAPGRPTTSRGVVSSGATKTSPIPTSCPTSCRSRSATTAPPRPAGTATRSTSARCTRTRAELSRSFPGIPRCTRRCGSTTCPPRPTGGSGWRPSR